MRTDSLFEMPSGIPVPEDDGAAQHLIGTMMPAVRLRATSGAIVHLGVPSISLLVLYCYPMTGRPDKEALGGTANWNAIPGARGCTLQTCAYRDNHEALLELGAVVYGVSTQTSEYQKEAVQRLELPFALLSDERLELCSSLRLPAFEVAGIRLLKRVTLIVRHGRIVHCFYPIFPPDSDATNVLAWLGAGRTT